MEVRAESPGQPDVARLIEAADAYAASLYPADSNHLLDIGSLSSPDVRFFVARLEGYVVGCGALRVDRDGSGEVKRMWLDPDVRGRGIGRTILHRIEDAAREERLSCLRLETGIHQHEALGLYRAAGFRDIGPFGDYREDPLSVFLEKALA